MNNCDGCVINSQAKILFSLDNQAVKPTALIWPVNDLFSGKLSAFLTGVCVLFLCLGRIFIIKRWKFQFGFSNRTILFVVNDSKVKWHDKWSQKQTWYIPLHMRIDNNCDYKWTKLKEINFLQIIEPTSHKHEISKSFPRFSESCDKLCNIG